MEYAEVGKVQDVGRVQHGTPTPIRGGNGSWLSYPSYGLDSLVHAADVIVHGRVASIIDEYTESLYPTTTPDPVLGYAFPPPSMGKRLYSLEVLDVLKGDVSIGNLLTVVALGTAAEPIQDHFDPVGSVNDQYLYFLGYDAGHEYYGIPYGAYGRLNVSGTKVLDTSYDPDVVPFATDLSPSQFEEAIATEVSAQQTASPTPLPTHSSG
jgi:hypothetical protein